MADTFIKASVDMREAKRGLTNLELHQFPFGYALALTRMAKRGQELVRLETAKKFKLHGKWIPDSIKIHGAQKSDIVRYHYGQSEVYTDPRIGFMTLHETGGIKNPFYKMALALPALAMHLAQGFRTATGKIAKKWRPANLLKGWNSGKRRPKKKGGGQRAGEPKAFIAKGKIMVRTGPKRYPLQTLYGFKGSARIKPVWQFAPTIERAVKVEFESIFKTSMKDAMASARP
jgi:hypothetical protein